MEESNIIKQKLERIYKEAMQNSLGLSLYDGKAGSCMFGALYCKHFKNEELDQVLVNNIQEIVDGHLINGSKTLAGGTAGISLFFLQMYRWGFIDFQDLEEMCLEDDSLSETSMKMLIGGNYDFLHGSLGIAYYLLERGKFSSFSSKLFDNLNARFSLRTDGMIANFDFVNNLVEADNVNTGLAHGIVSVLKFCIHCYSAEICRAESYELAQRIIVYLRSNQNTSKNTSYFPSCIIDNVKRYEASRMAWCYGDLTIAFVLYQSAKAFGDNDLEEFALEIFQHSMNRKTVESTLVFDAGVCHGSAGIAHIYNKMWHYTKNRKFKDACEYWISQTLSFDKFEDTISGYKRYYAPTYAFEPSAGLLEGSTGIGLVFLSYLTNDFSWDNCIMLN